MMLISLLMSGAQMLYIPLVDLSTLTVSNIWIVFSEGNEDSEEFSLSLDCLWTVPHQSAVGREGPFYGTDKDTFE